MQRAIYAPRNSSWARWAQRIQQTLREQQYATAQKTDASKASTANGGGVKIRSGVDVFTIDNRGNAVVTGSTKDSFDSSGGGLLAAFRRALASDV